MFCVFTVILSLTSVGALPCTSMMNIQDLPDDSDTSDEDYVPVGKEDVSEVESDGDPEEPLSDSEQPKSKNKRTRKTKTKRKKKVKADVLEINSSKENEDGHLSKVTVEDKKKKEDDLWADFMKDTGFTSKSSKYKPVTNSKSITSTSSSNSKTLEPPKNPQPLKKSTEKVKITQVFEFAGEEVSVEKEVSADSAEARLLNKSQDEQPKTSKGKRSAGLSGIGNVLSQLSKKPKISTLEKTKLDWDKFKKEENLEEELQTYNKGKDGYLERQDFLERADLRRFEIERNVREVERSKRFNSTL